MEEREDNTVCKVVSRLREVLQHEMPLRHLFAYPTIGELAAVIDSKTIENLNNEQFDQLLPEIEAISEEEAQRLLAVKPS
jgi:phosphopantetheine binding protein